MGAAATRVGEGLHSQARDAAGHLAQKTGLSATIAGMLAGWAVSASFVVAVAIAIAACLCCCVWSHRSRARREKDDRRERELLRVDGSVYSDEEDAWDEDDGGDDGQENCFSGDGRRAPARARLAYQSRCGSEEPRHERASYRPEMVDLQRHFEPQMSSHFDVDTRRCVHLETGHEREGREEELQLVSF